MVTVVYVPRLEAPQICCGAVEVFHQTHCTSTVDVFLTDETDKSRLILRTITTVDLLTKDFSKDDRFDGIKLKIR